MRSRKQHRNRLRTEQLEKRDLLTALGFASHEITSRGELRQPTAVIAVDVDDDGDLDVVSGSWGKVAWYENTDGQGKFGPQRSIANPGPFAFWGVFAADVDGDGDTDVVSSGNTFGRRNDVIAWYENSDGKGTFGPQQVIADGLDFAIAVNAGDLDGGRRRRRTFSCSLG